MKAFDFETHAIESRPNYPPEPVGLAINGKYLNWGHHDSVLSTDMIGREALKPAMGKPFVCHNAAFDIEVGCHHMGLPLPEGKNINDTMFLAFLLDPYGELALKPLAERYLKMPPNERDAVREWIYENKIIRRNAKKWGAHISKAPAALVGPYAIGDIVRTEQLYDHLVPLVKEAGMWEAYRRECDIMTMLLQNSMAGIPLAKKRLQADNEKYELILQLTEDALKKLWKKEIGSIPPQNWDSGDEIGEQLRLAGIALPLTPTGKDSTSKTSLEAALPNGKVKALLLYRSAIEKSLSTYLRPWLLQGKSLHCSWNQVRNYEDDGARTGRLSSSPNMQNITNPDRYDELHVKMKAWGCDYSWIEFPNMRSYIEAPKGYSLFALDYSQQELRFLAHYEDGALAAQYRDNPKMDGHILVQGLIKEQTGLDITRKHVKNIGFAKLYGAGVPKLASQMGVDIESAQRMVDAYNKALPSVAEVQKELKKVGKRGDAIFTIGGRRYYAEAPVMDEDSGWLRTFEYKLLNYLIQGSSADQTKEAMRLWYPHLRSSGDTRFLLTVHDELVGMAPTKKVKKEAEVLSECMVNAFKLDVPVVADAKYGQNYGSMGK
jgi:DNA polymerase I